MAGCAIHVIRSLRFGNYLFCNNCNVFYMSKLMNNTFALRNLIGATRLFTGERDPAPLFFSPDVQQILKKLTRIDLKKIYKSKKDEQTLAPPEYKFMTTDELNKTVADAEKRAEQRLQIPPIVKQRKEIETVLSRDPALKGYDEAKFIFTDITYGVEDKDRLIVVRDKDGTLRKASWEEQFRMNQIYFPQPGRSLRIPRMFEDEFLKLLLEQEKYEFVLDRACIQFEPDAPDYHRVTAATYAHIESGRKYDTLQSTRHFGALTFYLAWNRCIDNMLLENIHNDRVEDAVGLVRLFHILNPDAKSATVRHDGKDLPFIQAYIELDSSKKSALELALQTYLELQKQHQEMETGIQRAHGHNV